MNGYFTEEEMEYIYADIFDNTQDIYAEIVYPADDLTTAFVYMKTLNGENYSFDIQISSDKAKSQLNSLVCGLRRQRLVEKRLTNTKSNKEDKGLEM